MFGGSGRLPRLTPEAVDKVRDLMRETGCTLNTAICAKVGVAKSTAYAWERRGRNGEEPYATLLTVAEQARSAWQAATLAKLDNVQRYVSNPKVAAAQSASWQWKLERLQRREFGPQVTVKVEQAQQELLTVLAQVCDRLGDGGMVEPRQVLLATLDALEERSEAAPALPEATIIDAVG